MKDNIENVFVDSDVILDVILDRKPFVYYSQHFLGLIESNAFKGYTSSLILANCHYIVSNKKNKATADKSIQHLRSILNILPFTDKEISESLSSGFKDFEDGIQYYIALNNSIDMIVTRNSADYHVGTIKIVTPAGIIEG